MPKPKPTPLRPSIIEMTRASSLIMISHLNYSAPLSHHPLQIYYHIFQRASQGPGPILALASPIHALHSFSWVYALTFCRGDSPQISLTMEARKPKYSLFPTPPTSKPLSSIPHNPPAPEKSSPPDSGDPTTPQERSPSPPAEPQPPDSQDQPTPSELSHLSPQVAPRAQEQPSPESDSPVSLSEMTISSFSTASDSSLKPAPLSLHSPPQEPRKRPKRAFVRHGLGGAGNYHKRPDSSPHPDYSGFLASLLGTFSNKKRKTRQYPEGDSTGGSQYSNQALPLGAAEVLKRKMLGQASGGKRSTSSDGS